MDLRQLESFVEIAKQKSFSRAAETLYLSQPTLTGHIQSLENELETLLFNRYGKQVTLTEAGQIFYNHAVNILNLREQAYYSMNRYKGRMEGELAIAASTVPQICLLPGLLKAFGGCYPEISYEIKQLDSEGVISTIISGRMDFGFVGTVSSCPELEMFKLCQDRLILITPAEGKFSRLKGDSVTWEQIKNEKFILREEGSATKKFFLSSLRDRGIDLNEINVVANIENPATIVRCVRKGFGITFISERMVKEEIEQGLLRAFALSGFALSRDFYFINHKNRVLNPVARAFKDFTHEFFNPDYRRPPSLS